MYLLVSLTLINCLHFCLLKDFAFLIVDFPIGEAEFVYRKIIISFFR